MSSVSKRQKDLRYMHDKLRGYEEHLAALRTLTSIYSKDMTLGQLEDVLLTEIENMEYVLRRDRINHGKPE